MLKDCVSNLVGLSRELCDCLDTPAFDVTTSATGIYLEDLLDKDALAKCDGVWEYMNAQRDEAYKDVETDLQVVIARMGRQLKQGFADTVGKKAYTLNNVNTAGLRGMYIRPKVRLGTINLSSVRIWLSASEEVTLRLFKYSVRDDIAEEVDTATINSQAGQWSDAQALTDWKLLWGENDPDDLEWLIVYESSATTVNNDDCGCGGKVWKTWMEIGEARIGDENDPSTYSVGGSVLNGLRFEMNSYCDLDLCTNMRDDGFQRVIAAAVNYNTAIKLLNSPKYGADVSPKSLQGNNMKAAYIEQYSGEYLGRLDTLAVMHKNNGGCMMCDDSTAKIESLL